MTRWRRHATVAAVLLLATACEHAQPFGAPDLGPDQPFSSTLPDRLTFNGGNDLQPAWLPDGSGILYAFDLDRADHDRCLGVLPADGGRRTQTICHRPAALDADSTNVLEAPAVGPAGALAYLRTGSLVGAISPGRTELVVATLDAPDPGRVVLTLPYTAPDSVVHTTLTDLRWVDAHTLAYVAEVAVYGYNPVDTTVVPLSVVRLDLSATPARLTVLSGTQSATSLAVDSTGAVYYTLAGDSRVYRFVAGAAPDTAYDFGAAGAPLGISVEHGVLAAAVNGALYRVALASGSRAPITVPAMFPSAPALSPSARRVVVQLPSPGAGSDLWLVAVP